MTRWMSDSSQPNSLLVVDKTEDSEPKNHQTFNRLLDHLYRRFQVLLGGGRQSSFLPLRRIALIAA